MMTTTHNRVEVLHGVNFDVLGRRERDVYGDFSLPELEVTIKRFARELNVEASFFQTNHEGEFVEYLHRLPERADAAIGNAGAWTHYSWAIRDALAILPVPVVEVHLSEPLEREPWRHLSVVSEVASARFAGMGADGYRAALDWLQERAA
jgi:3-dehydroquinate dehydratase II